MGRERGDGRVWRAWRGLGWALPAALAAACAVNPATGAREFNMVSEGQEIAMGQQGGQSVRQSQALLPDSAMQAYVARIGQRIARASERPQLPWRFTTLDDPIINAFAMPGGEIFFTRGILTHFNSEAEFAAVMGHEIGHVTARHTARAMSRQQLAGLGLGLGALLSQDVAQMAGALQQGLGLLFLKFGRGDESQADELGFRYMVAQRYDPDAMADVFAMLSRVSGGGRRLPEWQSTHPDPENRERVTRARIDSAFRGRPRADLAEGRNEYLRRLDGMVYGENPRQGFFRGAQFLHPELAFSLTFPDGWQLQNGEDAVVAGEPQGAAVVQLQLDQGTPEEAARRFLGQQGVQVGQTGTLRAGIGTGVSATFGAQGQQGAMEGMAMWVAWNGRTFRVMGLSGAGGLSRFGAAFEATMRSLSPVRDRAVLDIQPHRVDIVTVPRAMTAEAFLQAFPSSVAAEKVLLVNNWLPGQQLAAGSLAKRIVQGRAGR
ncbi:MAG: M48 family metalloprotease [Gemmatimonadales bacterium]|nr:M48 family metalloprotease [Gemmatimonadales bacterium]